MFQKDIKVKIEKSTVFHLIDCYEDSPIYDEVSEEYQEMVDQMYTLCEPVLLAEFGNYKETPALMVLYSIGGGISSYATECFRQGDCLKGMLADAMADSALFSMESEVAPYIKAMCRELGMGICRRLEAPGDIPIEDQELVFAQTKAGERCGMRISSGYMIDPVKSNAIIYLLTPDQEQFVYEHNCRKCDRLDCKSRQVPDIPVEVKTSEKIYSLVVSEKESVLEALTKADSSYSAVCGGIGRCGKCKIRILEGSLPVTESDRSHFTAEELEAGLRLACRAYPEEPVKVELLFDKEDDFVVVAEHGQNQPSFMSGQGQEGRFGIAIDIGTTTIAMQLVSLDKGAIAGTYTALNRQRRFGADVISRMEASVKGHGKELRRLICEDLKKGIHYLVQNAGIEPDVVTEIAIAGNTTMIHLLMGYDCKGLGVYPFTPVNIALAESTYEDLLEENYLRARVRILPGISVFVGGDIVSGLYANNMDHDTGNSLLIDFGTNGEMALGNKDRILVTSTAAGPAFEGGNIQCGVGSVKGAIVGVSIQNHNRVEVKTIGDQVPIGICGTGVIEASAELLRVGLLDETGCLEELYFEEGYPLTESADGSMLYLTQKDIREIQLAKSAVRAGLETLFLRFGIAKEEVSKVYLAGGFGFHLNCQKAIEIGLLPEKFEDKVEIIGNSSLSGALRCLLEPDSWDRVSRIAGCAREVSLSSDKDFNRLYMEYMSFGRSDCL